MKISDETRECFAARVIRSCTTPEHIEGCFGFMKWFEHDFTRKENIRRYLTVAGIRLQHNNLKDWHIGFNKLIQLT
jgi:hypothetical protein